MRPISKGRPPAELTHWLAGLPAGSQPGWDDISTADKNATKQALLREQFFLCCYCEVRVSKANSHIEHLGPQSKAPADRFNFSNLLASCQGEGKLGKAPETCGQVRGNQPLPVTPLMSNCGAQFTFDSAGGIGHRSEPARETIRVLKLNAANLKQARRAAMAAVETFLPVDQAADIQRAARELLSGYSVADDQGQLPPFLSAIEQHLSSFL